MKCAECGRENLDDAKFCSYCTTPLIKDPEITDTGSTLRKIYNDFGYEKVFEDSRYITSALGDFVPDSEMISNSIEMVFHAGLGKVYKTQIRNGGNPDQAFYNHIKRIITDSKVKILIKKEWAWALKSGEYSKQQYNEAIGSKTLKRAIPCVNSKGKVCCYIYQLPYPGGADFIDFLKTI